jgi:FKBP-type peptidyl-prolyl cis-trans isomerase SlyD
VLDGNHPLAGLAIRMHVQVKAVRAATPEEIESGTVNDDAAGLLQVLPPKDRSQLH